MRKLGKYSTEEVRVLVEEYQELSLLRHKPALHARMMDLRKAFTDCPPKYKEALFLHGVAQFTTTAISDMLEISPNTVWVRYNRGIEWLTRRLNGSS